MEVFFTSPTLGKIPGIVTTLSQEKYQFKGRNILINIELCRTENGWVCEKEQWLLTSQIEEIGSQIDKMEKWLSV